MFIPIGDRLLVSPATPEEKTKGGILVSKKGSEKQDSGTVVAVGDGAGVQQFKVGDIVIFQKYGPQEVEVDGEKYVIPHIDEILAKGTK